MYNSDDKFCTYCRCDQYRWVSKGVFLVNCEKGFTLKKRSNLIDLPELNQREGDERFRRWEYWGTCNSFRGFFAMHYTGDHTIYKSFPHRSAKSKKGPFIRSAPIIKEKVSLN